MAKPSRLYDERGLYLEVMTSGSKLVRYNYRFKGKEKRLAPGMYPDVSLRDARDYRDDARRLLADGIDPGQKRRDERITQNQSSNTFGAIGREWFDKLGPNWSTRHRERVTRQFEADLFPWIGDPAPDDIDVSLLLACLRRTEARGAVHSAHRTRAFAGKVFRYTIATAHAKRDPSMDLTGAIPPVRKKNSAAIIDPEEVGHLLRAIDGCSGTFIVRCALQLAPLLFVRPGELRRARWKDFDFDGAEWSYRVSKTATDHIGPLSMQAVTILNELHPLSSSSEFVLSSARTMTHPMSENTINAALRRLRISKDEQSAHVFRAMARTILEALMGYQPD